VNLENACNYSFQKQCLSNLISETLQIEAQSCHFTCCLMWLWIILYSGWKI